MKLTKLDILLLMLISSVLLLMIANIGLFFRMNQLQSQVIQVLNPFRPPMGLEEGSFAPAFSLLNTEGEFVNLQDYYGQYVMIIFSSIECSNCQKIYADLNRLRESHPDIVMLMISRGSKDENRRLIQEESFTFSVLNWKDDTANEYKVPGVPWFYMIDTQGLIAKQGTANSLKQMEEIVKTNR